LFGGDQLAQETRGTKTAEFIQFSNLIGADLLIDAVYQGGRTGNAKDDPLGPLLKVSNSGGFRYRGRLDRLEMLVLTTSLNDPDWPDSLDRETGVFTYYGDNKRPGQKLHETPRKGNALLARIFEDAGGGAAGRARVPPIFLFANTGVWRDVQFLGLAIPGTNDLRAMEDLVAVWKTSSGHRFQNYRARFTVLDAGEIARDWIDSLISGKDKMSFAPKAWLDWVRTGRIALLASPRALEHRTKAEQLPADAQGREMIRSIHEAFAESPHDFEYCAAALIRLTLPDVATLDVTRRSRDGGRDAVGKLRIGIGPGAIYADFAVEAKCYGPSNSVGVREISRLISRLRHRQFGILVTTSWLDTQAYKEIKEDEHPIMVVTAADVVAILKAHGRGDAEAVRGWIASGFA
jgi:Restriction endonuclease AspBHI N-terminal/Restriction endonuclease